MQSLAVISPDSFEVFTTIDVNINNYDALFLFLGETETTNFYYLDSIQSQHLIEYLQANSNLFVVSNYLGENINDIELWQFVGIESEVILLPIFNIYSLLGIENTIMDGVQINYDLEALGIPVINNGDECILIGDGISFSYNVLHQFQSDTFKVLFSYWNIIHFHEILKRTLGYFGFAYVPVELISFSVFVSENNVNLNWVTASELNNRGFEIERGLTSTPLSVTEWEKIGFVEGKGTATETNYYSFEDRNLSPGNYSYRLKQIDFDGVYEYSNEIEVEVEVPDKFYLFQNYPNPFNPSTNIEYQIPADGFVSLTIFNAIGQEVSTLVNENQAAGKYSVSFSADKLTSLQSSALTSGLYFYTLRSGDFSETRKMILLK
jgi:hypothetical protein